MATDKIKSRFEEIEKLAHAAGLRHYDVQFFEVPTSVIYEVASYGLPTRYSHWSFGRCVTGDTYIYTRQGMKKIKDTIESLDLNFSENEFIPYEIDIYDDKNLVSTSHVYKSESARCLKINTDKGISLSGTYEHPILCLKNGKVQWIKMKDLVPGDCILARLGAEIFANLDDLDFCFKKHPYKILHNQQYKHVDIPDKMSEDLAFLCGVLSAEGGMTTLYGFTISINKSEKEFRQEIESRFRALFGIESVEIPRDDECCVFAYYSTKLRQFFEYIGIDNESCCNKQVPSKILSASKECWCKYLLGLFEGDGNVNINSIEIGLCSKEIIEQVQLMLLNLGIVSTTRFDILISVTKSSVVKRETYKHRLWVTGNKNLEKFKELIGFVSSDKKGKIEYACRTRKINKYDTRISEAKSIVKDLHKQCKIRKNDNELQYAYQNALCYNPTGDSLEKIINKSESSLNFQILSDLLNYLPLTMTEAVDVGSQTVYDFTVPEVHKFLTNGIVSHNTYQYQKTRGEMGHSKIYELILNNNPSYAFLDTSNTETINLMIAAHCYLPGTYVQTFEGIKLIEDVKSGDQVYSHKGRLCNVLAPTCNVTEGEVVTIQAGSYKFTQTSDHKLYAVQTSPDDRKKYRSWGNAFTNMDYTSEWVESGKLKPGDFLVVNRPPSLTNDLASISIPIKKILWRQDFDETLEVQCDEDFGELIGLYLAEGYARPKGQMGLCFRGDEIYLHYRSADLINKCFGLVSIKHSSIQNAATIEFNEICIAAYLREKLGHSCYIKHLPNEWMTDTSVSFLRGVLKGFLLGDGSSKTQPRNMGFTTTSPKLAMQMQQIGMHLGIFFGINPRDRSTSESRAISFDGSASGIYGNKVRELLDLPVREINRTWSGVIEGVGCFYVKINEVSTEEYSGIVHCLNVEDDHSFPLANGIITHNCFAHSDFFANNIMFREAQEENMVQVAKRHAEAIDQYRKDYGDDEVDEWLDVALSMERHIDVYKKLRRSKYEKRHIKFHERTIGEWEDLHPSDDPLVKKVVEGAHLPPHPEKDLLWFFAEYANMEDWQKRVFEIVRRESYYFYPQYRCVIAGSLVFCPGVGLVRIENLCPKEIGTICSSIPLVGGSGIDAGFKTVDIKTSHVHTMPASKTIEIELDMGITIEGTPEHPVQVLTDDLRIEMKKISQLKLNDYVVVRRNTQVFGYDSNLFLHLSKFETQIAPNHRHEHFSVQSLQKPANWESLAKIAGYVCSEGNFCNNTIRFSNKDKDIIEDYIETFSALFDLEPSVSKREDGVANITSYNERLYEVLNSLGFGSLKHSSTKEVPWFVLQSSKETQTSFLRAYFEGDGFNNGEKISATSKSKNLISQLQQMLLNMDIFSKILVDHNAAYGDFYRIDIRGLDASRFLDKVGFISDRKQNIAVSNQGRVKESEYIPYVLKFLNELRSTAKRGTYYECCDGRKRHLRFVRPSDKGQIRTKEIPRRILEELPEFVSNCKLLDFGFGQRVEVLFNMKNAIFQPVSKITPKEENTLVYDVTVPGDHLFLCNGIVNHNTKIINEGWASYWHAELMLQYSLGDDNDYGVKGIKHPLTSEEHLDFLSSHEKVVQSGVKIPLKVEQPETDAYGRPTGRTIKDWHPKIIENPNIFHYATRINPYYIGFRIFRDIKERWDKYYKEGFYEDEWGKNIPVTIDGNQKIREVMESEDDVSFLRNYLTEELCDKLHLFCFGSPETYNDNYKVQEEIKRRIRENKDRQDFPIDEQLRANKTLKVRTKNVEDIVRAMARVRNNYGVPCIVVRRVDSDGTLRLEHLRDDLTNIDIAYGEYTLQYIFKIWGRPVELIRRSSDHTHVMKYDASGFSLDFATADYPESIENKDSASSW